jgi:hypothetical protein
MKELENLFFELIQVALGKRGVLSKRPSELEWKELFDMASKQAVAGVVMAALERLSAQGQRPTQMLLFEWIGLSEKIRQGNQRMNRCCLKLQKRLKKEGVRSSILKGQGIAGYYDEGLRELRQSGDIDIFVDCGREKALRVVQALEGVSVESWDYKHAHLDIWEDVAVEMHYRVEVMLNLWKNRKLQKWFKEHEEEAFGTSKNSKSTNAEGERIPSSTNTTDSHSENLDTNTNNTNSTNNSRSEDTEKNANTDGADGTDELVMPTVEFNVFYILLHIYRHFLYEGVGLRQIMDYYFVLKNFNDNDNVNLSLNLNSNTDDTDKTDYAGDAIKMFGMERFAKGLMWVMKEVFAMPREWMICEADEKEGEYILKQVMEGGNFGHHDQRLQHEGGRWNTVKQVCRHNWHLVSHYPADVIWAPVWFVWHKCWKVFHS